MNYLPPLTARRRIKAEMDCKLARAPQLAGRGETFPGMMGSRSARVLALAGVLKAILRNTLDLRKSNPSSPIPDPVMAEEGDVGLG